MKLKKCPNCGRFTYKEYQGLYDSGKKINPDYAKCFSCGFTYEEHIQYLKNTKSINTDKKEDI